MARRADSLTQTVIDYVCEHGPVSSMDVFAAVDEIGDRQHLAVILSQACKDGRLQKYDAPAGSPSRMMYVKPGAVIPQPKASILHQAKPPVAKPSAPKPVTPPAPKATDAQVLFGATGAVLKVITESPQPVTAKEVLAAVPQLKHINGCSKIIDRLLKQNAILKVPAPLGSGQGVRYFYTNDTGKQRASATVTRADSSSQAAKSSAPTHDSKEAQHSTGFGFSRCIDGVVLWRGSQAFSLSNRELAEFIAAHQGA